MSLPARARAAVTLADNLPRVTNTSDLPPRRIRSVGRDKGRVALIAAAIVLGGLLLSVRFLSGFFVDYLWHDQLGRSDIFWGVLRSKLVMFAMF